MADHIIPLPESFRYINQFAASPYAPNPSLYRCVAASLAMLAQIAYPGRWIPEELEHDLYVQLAHGPDIRTDENGITKNAALGWMSSEHIGLYDNSKYFGNQADLLAVMQRQNEAGIPQLITVANENFLLFANTDIKLHNWTEPANQAAHSFIRVGFSDTDDCGLYFEPAAPGFAQPVPISWPRSIEKARIITSVAIMPSKMAAPPADFDWLHGTWPPAVPSPRVQDALSTLASLKSAYQHEDEAYQQLKNARDAAFSKIIADLMA